MAKKILLINGGGAFGVIPAHFLSEIDQATGKDFRECIDCLAGSSIGGVLAAIYACGHHPRVIEHAFIPACEKIFRKRMVSYVNPLSAPLYPDTDLNRFIHDYTADNRVEDIRMHYPNLDMFFAGLDATEDYFKVWDNIKGNDDGVLLSDICRITCAAPTYFSGVDLDGHAMVDCGLIENTMLMTTTIGYKNARNVDFEDMDVMLIGTGYFQDSEPLTAKKYNSLSQLGILYKLIIPYVTQSNELASIYWARGLGLRNFYYFNPVVIKTELDDTSALPGVLEDAWVWDGRFLEMWDDFMSDKKKDPCKDVRDLIVLPPNLSESYYERERSRVIHTLTKEN